jgi:hypothetical protein
VFVAAALAVTLAGVAMNARTVLRMLALSTAAVALGAGPASPGGGPPARAAPVAVSAPAPRARPALGSTPKQQFRVNDQTIKVDPREPGVRAVRAIPPQTFEASARARSVRAFYAKQAAARARDKADRADVRAVGPFRREFVWWTYGWARRDRARWAWNNYAYFDRALWAQWMFDREFAALIAEFRAAGRPQVLGFIPEQYAVAPPEAIYCDEYIEAVYNPVYTTPSIVVDGSAGGRVGNLIEGVPRTFGTADQAIGPVDAHAVGLQFVSIPAGFDPTYQVEVKRDGDLFIFGPKKTPLGDGLGADAANWHPVHNVVVGSGIDVVYQRHVAAGEHIRLHGVEWSLASEQIELLSNATPAARTAVSLVDAELGQMVKADGPIFDAAPELKDYLRIAQGSEQAMLTPLGNINDEKVGLYYAALAKTQKVCLAAMSGSADRRVTASGNDLVRQVKGLAESLGEVDELRDPSAPDPANAVATAGDGGPPSSTARPGSATAGPTDHGQAPGRPVNLLASVDLSRDVVSGTWTSDGGALHCDGTSGQPKLLEFRYLPPAEYDYEVVFSEDGSLHAENFVCMGGGRQFFWVVGDGNNATCYFGHVIGAPLGKVSLTAGHRYTTLIKVRRDGMRAYLDGRELGHVDTDYSNVSLPRRLKLRAMNTLGLGFASEHTTVESATITEVGGDEPSSAATPPPPPAPHPIELVNHTGAAEGRQILDGVATAAADTLSGVGRAELVAVHDAVDFKSHRPGVRQTVAGEYASASIVGHGSPIMLYGVHDQWEPATYLVVYRIQSVDSLAGDRLCFCDVCSHAKTVASNEPSGGSLPAGQWALMPVTVHADKSIDLEYRFWPREHVFAIDRVYVFRLSSAAPAATAPPGEPWFTLPKPPAQPAGSDK